MHQTSDGFLHIKNFRVTFLKTFCPATTFPLPTSHSHSTGMCSPLSSHTYGVQTPSAGSGQYCLTQVSLPQGGQADCVITAFCKGSREAGPQVTTNFLSDVTRKKTNILLLHVTLSLLLSSDFLSIQSYHGACEVFLHLSHTGSDLDFRFSDTRLGEGPNWVEDTLTHTVTHIDAMSEIRQNQV